MLTRSGNGIAWINGEGPCPAELAIETEVITLRSEKATEPDPAWEHTDPAGHFHAYTSDGKLPTLEATAREMPCDGRCGLGPSCEGYTITVWHCRICRAEVDPAVITRYNVTTRMPGLTSWHIRVDRAPDIDLNGEISVRFAGGGQEFFGIGVITGLDADSDGLRLHIAGHHELGHREIPADLAHGHTL